MSEASITYNKNKTEWTVVALLIVMADEFRISRTVFTNNVTQHHPFTVVDVMFFLFIKC